MSLFMFRMLVLQSLYNLSDEQVEYQVRDRLSFTRFSAARHRGWHSGRHDALAISGDACEGRSDRELFERFGQHLEAKGYIGQMVDATIVPVPQTA